jgi:hypothetical protein
MEIIANVNEECDEESHQKQLLLLINKATERSVTYTGNSWSSGGNTCKELLLIQLSFSNHQERDENVHVTLCLWMALISMLSEIQFRISIFWNKESQQYQSCYPSEDRKYIFIGAVRHWRGL